MLSLWKVDDDATALLMTRFYQNLLGMRPGLKSPLPKAEALAEAKAWLRVRGARRKLGRRPWPRSPAARSFTARRSRTGTCGRAPTKTSTYWAGFILIGSPD